MGQMYKVYKQDESLGKVFRNDPPHNYFVGNTEKLNNILSLFFHWGYFYIGSNSRRQIPVGLEKEPSFNG